MIERARRLASSPFAKGIPDFNVRWSPPDPPALVGADPLHFDAALGVVRQFLEPSGPVSFAVVRERIAEDPDLGDSLRRDIDRIVRELDAALDQPPALRIKVKGQTPPLPREILDVFLGGGLEVLAEARREPVATWLGQPSAALLVRALVQVGLGAAVKAIAQLRRTCERELLQAAGPE